MEIVKCEVEKCNGNVCWDEDRSAFLCDGCGALYQ